MRGWSWARRHRGWCALGVAVIVLAVAGVVVWAVFLRTVASPISLGDALRLYQQDQHNGSASAPSGRSSGPLSAGVYSYRTTGGESLSIPGASRSFPARTEMVVSSGASGCSVVDWVPIVQHTESTTICRSAGHALSMVDSTTHLQIGGSTTTTVITCPVTTYLVPPRTATSARHQTTCQETGPTASVMAEGQLLGATTIAVQGQRIQTVHVRLTLHLVGGVSTSDFWLAPSSGLVVREREVTTFSQTGVHYRETMSALLLSTKASQ